MYISKKKKQFLFDCKNISTMHLKNIYGIFVWHMGLQYELILTKTIVTKGCLSTSPLSSLLTAMETAMSTPPFHN